LIAVQRINRRAEQKSRRCDPKSTVSHRRLSRRAAPRWLTMMPQSHTTIRSAVVAGGCNDSNAGELGERGDAEAPSGDAGRTRWLGLARGGGRQRHPPGAHSHLRSLVGELPPRLLAYVGRGRRPAVGADGQFRGRTSQHRRRPPRAAGFAAHQRGDRWRRDRTGACTQAPDRTPAADRRHLPPSGVGVAGRCAFASGSCRGARKHSRRGLRADAPPCLYRRPRYAAAIGGGGHCPPPGGAAARRSDRDGQRPVLRHGSRQALGPRCQGLSRDRGRRGAALRGRSRSHCGCLYARDQ